jgi:threonine dehydrogenase-like Zn-dependent dehydrogenase
MGAGRVIVCDHLDYRLDFVRRWAKVETFNFTQVEDVVLFCKKITDWIGADVCIDAVADATGSMLQTITGIRLKLQAGSATALNWCINSVRKGGTVSIAASMARPSTSSPSATC